jgi:hypothetical protein
MEIHFFGAWQDICPICVERNGNFTLMELHLVPLFCVFTLSALLVNTYRGRIGGCGGKRGGHAMKWKWESDEAWEKLYVLSAGC